MKPASFSTEDPPVPIENPILAEYILALRRRIEVQLAFIEQYTAAKQTNDPAP